MKYRDAVASLAVHDVIDKDKGLYTCEASNIHGYTSSSAALRIKGTPHGDVDQVASFFVSSLAAIFIWDASELLLNGVQLSHVA